MTGSQRLALRGYQVLLTLLVPLFLLRLWWRGRIQPGYRAHWPERLGLMSGLAGPAGDGAGSDAVDTPGAPVIWIHAVSVGETRACVPIVTALRSACPNATVLLTHMTPTGRETGAALFGDQVRQAWLPYDTPPAVAAFLAHWRPVLGLLVETEVWPSLAHACAARQIPLWLVNARLSRRSARGYARVAGLARPAFGALAGVLAQAPADARRLHCLGARVRAVTGNLKFDAPLPADEVAAAARLRTGLGSDRPVWLAASTREGEEALLLAAWAAALAAARPDPAATQPSGARRPLLVLVPRHPQRFDMVAQLVEQAGLACARRSDWSALAPPEPVPADVAVVLGDSMGELGTWYRAVDLAWVGGSLLPLGGQNLLEACARGCPVVLGPSQFNFAEASQAALACGAAVQVPDAAALVAEVQRLLADPVRRSAMAAAGMSFIATHRGATARTLQAILPEGPTEDLPVRR